MRLTPRLKCIADMVGCNDYPADIGTDHAYIPIYLIMNKICIKVIGTDIKQGPLNRASSNIAAYNLEDSIKLKKGPGLKPVIDDDINCAILSGMGGYLICNILESDKKKAEEIKYFIFQPMQDPEVLREYLYRNGYKIFNEKLVKEDNKIYEVIAARHGIDTVNNSIYYEIGKKLIENNDSLIKEFIYKKIEDTKKVISMIQNEDSANAKQRLFQCREKLIAYEGVLKCL